MWISPAYAQGAPADDGGMLMSFLPLILIFVVFYFLLIRPQQKKMKDHKAMLGQIGRGDRIVTGGGIVGTVTKINSDTEMTVEIAQGTKVRVMRDTVSQVVDKKAAPPPPKDEYEDDEEGDDEEGGDGGEVEIKDKVKE
jgi:preprotein translocase subunit YajC